MNKDELLRAMPEKKNSPSALFGLLRHFSPLNKKNSLRSNSFLFLTLRKAPPLHAQKVRPDLYPFLRNIASLVGVLSFPFFASLVGTWCLFRKKSSWWNYFAVCVFVLNGNNCIFVPWERNLGNDSWILPSILRPQLSLLLYLAR